MILGGEFVLTDRFVQVAVCLVHPENQNFVLPVNLERWYWAANHFHTILLNIWIQTINTFTELPPGFLMSDKLFKLMMLLDVVHIWIWISNEAEQKWSN